LASARLASAEILANATNRVAAEAREGHVKAARIKR
jgi:hypothetical protein